MNAIIEALKNLKNRNAIVLNVPIYMYFGQPVQIVSCTEDGECIVVDGWMNRATCEFDELTLHPS